MAEAVLLDGAVVVEGLIEQSTVDALSSEIDPVVDARRPGFRHHGDDSFYGGNTKRVQGLASKSPTFVDAVLLNETLRAVADAVLLQNCGSYWMSQAETIFIGPGNPAQVLHRDDLNWSVAQRLGIDLQVSALVALGDYDAAVGATMVIPDSHRWPLDRPIDPADAFAVEMQPGDALVYTGRVVHGGGENTTSDRWRRALYIGFLLGWLTPEEAVSRSIWHDVASRLPERARQLLGWSTLRGNPATAAGCNPAAEALQLWQLDADDLASHHGLFIDE